MDPESPAEPILVEHRTQLHLAGWGSDGLGMESTPRSLGLDALHKDLHV